MSQTESIKIKSNRMQVLAIQPIIAKLHLFQENRLNEAPVDRDRVYVFEDKKWGQPKFRIKKRTGLDPEKELDSFVFTKDETTKKITLSCVIEVYRDEPDVYPLSIRNPQIKLEYETGGRKVQKNLTISQSPMIDAVNILQDLHAETEIEWDEIKHLLTELKDPSKSALFKLTITAELWWHPVISAPPPSNPVINIPIFINPAILHSAASTRVATQPGVTSRVRGASRFIRVRDHRTRKPIGETSTQPTPATTTGEPQKIDLQHDEVLLYTKDDAAVFGPLSSEFEVKGYKWVPVNLVKENVPYTILYRPTAEPDVFFFLPQVFRIKAKEQNGEPKMSITMAAGENAEKIESYRINIGITVIPYYNPKAKKDLYKELDKVSKGTIKFCDLRLGGYKSAQFKLRDAFAGENAVFRGKIQESIASIDPVNGFTLTVDCSLESFDFFKREISDGLFIGDIIFELVSEKEGKEETQMQSVPVELDIRKLAGVPVETAPIMERSEEAVEIKGFYLHNTNSFPISVGGTELILLSEIGERVKTVYDADYDIGVLTSWPVTLDKQQKAEVLLNVEDIAELQDQFWNQLVCEPHGIAINTNPDDVLAKVIDYATGDPQIWRLEISCPLFEAWSGLDETQQLPFKQVHSITVEIKNEEGAVFSVKLDRTKALASLEMARSINQILRSQQLSSRRYQYRVGTVYIINPAHWTEWKDPESTAADFLYVFPKELA